MSTSRPHSRPRKFRNFRILSSMLVVAIGLSALALNLSAQPRDRDGNRMQAQKVALGTNHKDTLAPPGDAADWRYIQIENSTRLTITVSTEPTDQNVTVTLTTATGNELAKSTSNKGRLEIARQLDPGIYYINIQSGSPVSYRMSIQ